MTAPQTGREDAHRKSEVARLLDLLNHPQAGLRILGISGPGGVGKSYLLNHVLDRAGSASLRYLKLAVDGSNEQVRGDFFGLLNSQLARPGLPPPAKPGHDYFPHVRNVASIHRALVDAVSAELRAASAPPEMKTAALALLAAGRRLNKIIPRSREYLDVSSLNLKDAELEHTLEEAWRLVSSLRSLRDSGLLPGPIRDVLGLSYRARVKTDLYNVTAEAFLTDLSAAIGGYRKQDIWRLTKSPIPGVDRLLLVIDDFEAIGPVLEDFLVGALIPRLADAPFPTTMIVLGRDDLDAMHPAWNQHCRKYLCDPVRLAPLAREEALDLLARAGVPEARREGYYESTQGFPFLLSLLVEELGADGADSALFLRKFFDRTTRWMSARERDWFMRVCYLDQVNIDSIASVSPNEDPEKIQDWFEREASIRDPSTAAFRVRPLIREKVLRYLELRSPSRHREMQRRAAAAAAPPATGA